jgi:hypothetical protein
MVQSYVCDEAFKRMKPSLERGEVEKFEEKWSKMYGIRKAYWKHPRRSKYARRHGFPQEGYEAVVKKRFRKKPMYDQDDMDLRLLAPFDDGTIVEAAMADELTMGNFITGSELGIYLPSLSHLHESANDPTLGQTYIERNDEMTFRMKLEPSFEAITKTLAGVESHRGPTKTYLLRLQHVHTVPPRILNTQEKHG